VDWAAIRAVATPRLCRGLANLIYGRIDMTATSSGSPADIIYTDLENELNTTRRMLERFPSGHNEWRPHERSRTLVALAGHVAELPGLGMAIVANDMFDFAAHKPVPKVYNTAADLLAVFDERVKALRPALAAADSAALATSFTLRAGDRVILKRPRGEAVRHMVINHIIHHRAQLGVYYRMLGVPLPASYGPSADELE
jgi:uncharacterized damage-inducible protein DinB